MCAGLGVPGLEPPPVHPSVLLGRDQGWTGGGENSSLVPRLLSVAQGLCTGSLAPLYMSPACQAVRPFTGRREKWRVTWKGVSLELVGVKRLLTLGGRWLCEMTVLVGKSQASVTRWGEDHAEPWPRPQQPCFPQALGLSLSGLPSDPQSLGEMQQELQKTLTSPAEAAGFLHGSRDSGGSSKDSSCDTDDFVMVPAQFPGKGPPTGWAGGSLQMCQIHA